MILHFRISNKLLQQLYNSPPQEPIILVFKLFRHFGSWFFSIRYHLEKLEREFNQSWTVNFHLGTRSRREFFCNLNLKSQFLYIKLAANHWNHLKKPVFESFFLFLEKMEIFREHFYNILLKIKQFQWNLKS